MLEVIAIAFDANTHLEAKIRNMTKKRPMTTRTAAITFLIKPNMSGSPMLGSDRPSPAKVSPIPLPSSGLIKTGFLLGSDYP